MPRCILSPAKRQPVLAFLLLALLSSPQFMTAQTPSAVTPESTSTIPNFGGFYAAPVTASADSNIVATVSGDFNHDGKPDVALVNGYSGTFTVVLNDGAGGFKLTQMGGSVPHDGSTLAIDTAVAADLNGDGYADMILGEDENNSYPRIPRLFIFLNQKNGTFSNPTTLTLTGDGSSSPEKYAYGVAQSTSSKDMDIVAGLPSGLNGLLLQTFLNSGSGTFTAKPVQTIVFPPNQVLNPFGHSVMVFRDVNHDGKQDLLFEKDDVVKPTAGNYVYAMLGNGDGTFQQPTANHTVVFPGPCCNSPYSALAAESLTADTSKVDLVLKSGQEVYESLGNGDGTFKTPTVVLPLQSPIDIGLADFNNDGKPDLAVVGPGSIVIYAGKGDGTFTVLIGASVAAGDFSQPNSTVFADFNGDGKMDFASSSLYGNIELAEGDGTGSFKATPILHSTSAPFLYPYDFQTEASPDLNGDGIPDLVGVGDGSIVSAVATGKRGFAYKLALPQDAFPGRYIEPIAADFNGDGKQDVVITSSNGTAAVALSKGDGTLKTPVFIIKPPITLACALGLAATGDINGDGKLDLVFPYFGDNGCSTGTKAGGGYLIALGNGDGTFKTPTFAPSDQRPEAITLGAYHGKNKQLDLIVSLFDPSTSALSLNILDGLGNGTFAAPILITSQFGAAQLLTYDFNQDGKQDLTMTGSLSAGASGTFLFAGNDNGTFADPTAVTQQAPQLSTYADLNGDGIPDLISSSQNGLLSVNLGLGKGVFSAPHFFFLESDSATIAAGKYLGDNTISLVIPTTYGGGTAFFMNQGGTTLTTRASSTAILTGQNIILATTLTPTLTGQPTPSGTISFYDGAALLGTTSVDGTLATTRLSTGTHTITTKYSGDTHFNPNTGSALIIKVSAPALSLTMSPASLAFPATTIGSASPAQTITLKNTGNAAVTISYLKAGGTNYNAFVTSATTCSTTLAAAATCTASIEFKPTAAGTATATYNATDNAAGSPQHVTLSGTATATVPLSLTFSPASIAFPATTAGSTSAAQNITVKNTGKSTVTFSSLKVGGTNYNAFPEPATTCKTTLAAAATCTVSLTFKPNQKGTFSADLHAEDNATGNPQNVTLSGTGN